MLLQVPLYTGLPIYITNQAGVTAESTAIEGNSLKGKRRVGEK